MIVLSLAGLALFMLTALVVGLRLFGLFLRTRRLPELLLSVALLCVGFLPFAVGTAAKLLVTGSEGARFGFTIAGLVVETAGVLSLVAFAWRVFHADRAWAKVVAAVLAAAMVAAVAGEIGSGQLLRYSDAEPISGPIIPLALAARGLGPAWVSVECLRYHGMLRRRLRLGLAEPLVVHRVLLWGTALGASALGYAATVAHRIAFGTGLREHVWAVGLVSLLAMVSACGIALAFFPPARYRAWVEARAPRPPDDEAP